NAERLSFRYSYENRFPTVPQLAGRYILSHFNSVFKGNSTLENQQYHSASLRYFKHKMFQGYRLNLMTSVQKRESQFKIVTQLSGIEQNNTVMLFETPEHFWTISG